MAKARRPRPVSRALKRQEPSAPLAVAGSGPQPSRPIAPTAIRVAHALSSLGYCSRREGERLIAQGRVCLNGQPVGTPATLIDLRADKLAVDGKEIVSGPVKPKYLAVNKPRGVVSTVRDPHAERTVVQLVDSPERLYPVGRLDKESEGLIILTNDGFFANRVAHPRYETDREYLAGLAHRPLDADLERLRRGVPLDDGPAVPVSVEVLRDAPRSVRSSELRVPRSALNGKSRSSELRARNAQPAARSSTWLRIVLREGRNREVRRMLEAVGHPVQRLVRTRVGPVNLGNLAPGAFRDLTDAEVRAFVQGSGGRPGTRGPRQGLGAKGWGLGQPPKTPSDAQPSNPDPQRRVVPFVVAIDGPSGAGKTTVGKLVAERLGAAFLDTGVLYRALTLRALEDGVSPGDAPALTALARVLNVETRMVEKGGDLVLLGGRDVTDAIRSPTVDAFVSQVASHAAVRDALVEPQRRVADGGSAVVIGRDIGTVIFPDAQVKVFLEASPIERARRRAEQSGDVSAEAAVQHDMEQRDASDRGRAVAPLEAAADAVIIETDGVPVTEVADRVYSLVPASLRGGGG